MTETDPPPPESLLPYATWTQEALRHVVRRALAQLVEEGLPGDHHFYLTFRTDHPAVGIPAWLRAKYPREITIVLQHQYRSPSFDPAADMFGVGLSFGGAPATLRVPIAAVTGFADPAVRFGLQFEAQGIEEETPAKTGPRLVVAEEPEPEAPEEPKRETPAETPQVVSLDAFRRKPPRP